MTEIKLARKSPLTPEQRFAIAHDVMLLIEQGWAVNIAAGFVSHHEQISLSTVWRCWRSFPEHYKNGPDVAKRRLGMNTINGSHAASGITNQKRIHREVSADVLNWVRDHLELGVEPSTDKLYGRLIADFYQAETYIPGRAVFGEIVRRVVREIDGEAKSS